MVKKIFIFLSIITLANPAEAMLDHARRITRGNKSTLIAIGAAIGGLLLGKLIFAKNAAPVNASETEALRKKLRAALVAQDKMLADALAFEKQMSRLIAASATAAGLATASTTAVDIPPSAPSVTDANGVPLPTVRLGLLPNDPTPRMWTEEAIARGYTDILHDFAPQCKPASVCLPADLMARVRETHRALRAALRSTETTAATAAPTALSGSAASTSTTEAPASGSIESTRIGHLQPAAAAPAVLAAVRNRIRTVRKNLRDAIEWQPPASVPTVPVVLLAPSTASTAVATTAAKNQ